MRLNSTALLVGAALGALTSAPVAIAAPILANPLASTPQSDPVSVTGGANAWQSSLTHSDSLRRTGLGGFREAWNFRVTNVGAPQSVRFNLQTKGAAVAFYALYSATSPMTPGSAIARGAFQPAGFGGRTFTELLLSGDYILDVIGFGLNRNAGYSMSVQARYNQTVLATPIPAPIALFGAGLAAIAAAARRRKA
jgi:hypothetical protein